MDTDITGRSVWSHRIPAVRCAQWKDVRRQDAIPTTAMTTADMNTAAGTVTDPARGQRPVPTMEDITGAVGDTEAAWVMLMIRSVRNAGG